MIKINYKIAAVVVTYNRKKCLIKNIQCLLNQKSQLDRIYIIDNASTDGTNEYINKILNNNKVSYVRLNENIGGSGGFYTGIKYAYENEFDYIWGMDDDAYPDVDALYELKKCQAELDNNVCLWSNCDGDSDFSGSYKEVNSWMFVGFYLPRNVIKKIGYPRKDFFIYHDDSEYAYRIINNGFKIYKVENSHIHHGNLDTRPFYSKNIVGKNIRFPVMSDWKLYYFIRNGILMYNYNDKNKYKQIFITSLKIFMKLLILNKKQLKIFRIAFIHGILSVTGKKLSP